MYGNLGTSALGNIPGARSGASGARDSNGNFWLFGGQGFDSAGNFDTLNDLWEFNPFTNEWTWASGSSRASCWRAGESYFGAESCGQKGIYGTIGVAGPVNVPGSRSGSVAWVDSSGSLWIFGGYGYDSAGVGGPLNDLWRFDSSTLEWTWAGGGSTFSICGYSGNQGYPLPCPMGADGPSGRDSSANWIDSEGGLWLFGGQGLILPRTYEVGFNDLLWFNASDSEWEKKTGCNETSANWGDCSQSGIYGTLGIASSQNSPGARFSTVTWTDKGGNLWLFGGNGTDSAANIGALNDLWKFDPSKTQWAWMGGSSKLACSTNENGSTSCAGQSGVYGTIGVPSSTNYPGARNSAMSWTDSDGNFWLFGGNGYDAAGNRGELNDVWVLNPATLQWAWMAGSSTIDCKTTYGTAYCGKSGVYGQLGIAGAENTPGGRDSSVGWVDRDGSFWLFGGKGYDSLSSYPSWLNDLWEYNAQAPVFPTAAPTFSVPSGTYTSTQTVTIADVMPEAAIYYTTDGSVPTTTSTVYTSAIAVSKTETIQAMAIAAGYPASEIANATYTIKLPPTFTMGSSVTSMTLNSGSSGVSTLTITPQNGFESAVSFACSGLPTGATCSFNPATVTPSGSAVTTAMTISTAKRSASLMQLEKSGLPTAAFAVMLGIFGIRRSRRRGLIRLIVLATAGLGLLTGCGSGGNSAGGGGGGSNPVTYMTSVTATSGTLQQTVTIALTVN